MDKTTREILITAGAALLCTISSEARAADHELEVGSGVAWVRRADALVSPLPYAGLLPTAAARWSLVGRRATTQVGLSAAHGGLRSGPRWEFTRDGERRTATGSPQTLVDLHVAHGRSVGRGTRWQFTLGAAVTTHLEALTTVYGFTGTFTYLGTAGLGPWLRLALRPSDRHRITLAAKTSAVSWVARSPYGLNDDEYIQHTREHSAVRTLPRLFGDGRLVSPLAARRVELDGAWQLALSAAWSIGLRARLEALHVDEPRGLERHRATVSLGLWGTR